MFRLFILLSLFWPAIGTAQGLQLAFSDVSDSANAPLEMSADAMAIDQEAGTAMMTGNVIIIQGQLRLTAPKISVSYGDGGEVQDILAEGGVTFVTAAEEVEAQTARYRPTDDSMVLTGDVLLVQGPSAVSAETMVINLASGTAQLEGRVRTVLQPSSQ
ncbi:MAG: lipopolysaccharide transport periplasmic protein LptA [Pseudomonadota bacterium]